MNSIMRDSKILTIWEGTSFIHANDLIGRKMRMKEGAAFAAWMKDIKDFHRCQHEDNQALKRK